MKHFCVVILILLCSLGYGQVPTVSNSPEIKRSKNFPLQLPSDASKQPVRTQPFGELLSPAVPDAPKSIAPNLPKKESSPVGDLKGGFEKKAENPVIGKPSQLPRKIGAREIDTKELPKTPAELIATALDHEDEENRLTGRDMALVEALSYANSPQRQLEVTHAYWNLFATVAHYNLRCQLVRRLEGFSTSTADDNTMRTALASATAAREETRCLAITAQHALAEVAMLDVGDSLPLPIDMPHVGAYRTLFDEIFSNRPAPPQMRLIHRALPIYRKAIDARTQAILAADKSLLAATADYKTGRGDFDDVVSRIAQLNRQHLALVDSVCNYNHEIVKYAVASLGRPVSGPALVSMLIKTKHGQPTYLDPMTKPASAISPQGNRPTLAPPRLGGRKSGEPLRLEPQKEPALDNGTRSVPPSTPAVKEPMWLNPPHRKIEKTNKSLEPETKQLQTRPVVPVQPPKQSIPSPQPNGKWLTPMTRTTNKPQSGLQLPESLQGKGSATARAEHLVQVLYNYEDSNLSTNSGRTIELADYLDLRQGTSRQELIEAFWICSQRAAESLVLTEQSELLNEIQVAHSKRLEAVRLANQADLFDAKIRLLESQFMLTNLVGKTTESIWLTAFGVPSSTSYHVAAGAVGSETWEFRHQRAMIPAIHKTLCRQADAVVEADSARKQVISNPNRSVNGMLDCTLRQTEETMAFLKSVTAYNNAIARHVLQVLPPGVSNQVLVDKLLSGS